MITTAKAAEADGRVGAAVLPGDGWGYVANVQDCTDAADSGRWLTDCDWRQLTAEQEAEVSRAVNVHLLCAEAAATGDYAAMLSTVALGFVYFLVEQSTGADQQASTGLVPVLDDVLDLLTSESFRDVLPQIVGALACCAPLPLDRCLHAELTQRGTISHSSAPEVPTPVARCALSSSLSCSSPPLFRHLTAASKSGTREVVTMT